MPVAVTIITSTLLAALICLGGCASPEMPSSGPKEAVGTILSPTASVFPMENYDQNVDRWIDPTRPDYRSPLINAHQQAQEVARFRRFYFGGAETTEQASRSPWDPTFILEVNDTQQRALTVARIQRNVHRFGTTGSNVGYGPNLRPYRLDWIQSIDENIDNESIRQSPNFDPSQRAITVNNALLRLLPTSDPLFYDPRLPGEGYPFDNLQETALRPGTPIYIVGRTRNKAWLYVIAPDVSGWIEARDAATVDASFVAEWRRRADQTMGAIIGANVVVSDTAGLVRFAAPIGTVLPLIAPDTVLIPVADIDQRAQIRHAHLTKNDVTAIPYEATPEHFAGLIKALLGRPYGWGGTGLYNDCSLDLKSLFTPFGIWLPRHSSAQVARPGMVDLSSAPVEQRIDYLRQHGRPFMTLIGLPGHVMLYLGNQIVDGRETPIVYEEIWGLSPADHSRRAIVGQSAILPLLDTFPEDRQLASQAAQTQFRLGYIVDPAEAASAADTTDATAGKPGSIRVPLPVEGEDK